MAPRHEFVGDLILIKLDSKQREYGKIIGQAMLMQHARTRAVFEDRGSVGEYRVRDLNLLAVRDGFDSTTRTQIIESGHQLWMTPQPYTTLRVCLRGKVPLSVRKISVTC